MLVEELFIILLDISDLYGVRYLTTICMFFSLNKLLDIFGPLHRPLPQNRARGRIPPDPPLIGPVSCYLMNALHVGIQ